MCKCPELREGIIFSESVLSLSSLSWTRAGILAKCLIAAGLLRNSHTPLGYQPEDQRADCDVPQHQILTESSAVSGSEIKCLTRVPRGGHKSADQVQAKQRCRHHLTSACQIGRREGPSFPLQTYYVYHSQGPVGIPTLMQKWNQQLPSPSLGIIS